MVKLGEVRHRERNQVEESRRVVASRKPRERVCHERVAGPVSTRVTARKRRVGDT